MTPDIKTGIAIIIVMVVWEIVRLTVRQAFIKFTSPPYITKEECQTCSDGKDGVLAELKKELRQMKELLFSMALHVKMDENKIKKILS